MIIECRYCETQHGDMLLCGPAKRVLDALAERGQRFDLPTVEFPEAITTAGAFGGATVLVGGLVAKAGCAEVAGTVRPVLILTGQDIEGGVLPEWIVPGDSASLRKISRLVTDMTEMAIRRAKEAT